MMISQQTYGDHVGMKWCIGLLALLLVVSCKKTNYEQLERPYNDIERFSMGGYNELDSINAIIKDDEIILYWSADAELPKSIKPNILTSEGATISPASGEAVSFSDKTVYTVTAEDGTAKEYKLRPVINEAVPVVSELVGSVLYGQSDGNSWSWATTEQSKINGQYFLNGGDVSHIHVYAQRLRDGFEFDLTVDEKKTTGTQLVVDLPKFTAEQDSGQHRIWVQVGDYPSNSVDVWITQPRIEKVATSVTFKEAGQTVYVGDTLHYTFNLNDNITPELFGKYYTTDDFDSYMIYFNALDGSKAIGDWNYHIDHGVWDKNQFKYVITEEFVQELRDDETRNEEHKDVAAGGYYLSSLRPNYKDMMINAEGRTTVVSLGNIREGQTLLETVYPDEATMKKTIVKRRE